jgi:hypothetical protein
VQAIGHESDKDVRLDPMLESMKNWAQHQVVFEVLKGRFDFGQLNAAAGLDHVHSSWCEADSDLPGDGLDATSLFLCSAVNSLGLCRPSGALAGHSCRKIAYFAVELRKLG